MKKRGTVIVLTAALPAVFLIFILLEYKAGIIGVSGNSKMKHLIAVLGEDTISYQEVRVPSDKPALVTENTTFIRIIISGVGCSTCFEELVNALNSYAGLNDDRILSLVITNPDRNSAFQLKRMHGINVPLYITDDQRLRKLGSELGSAFIFSSRNSTPVYNLSPVRSADDIINYMEDMEKLPE